MVGRTRVPSGTAENFRYNRLVTVASSNLPETLTYNFANQILTETFSGGPLNGLSVTNGYDQYLRRTNLTALASGVLAQTSYGYAAASRLSTVGDGHNNTATYGYLANSPQVSHIVFATNGSPRMTTTKTYDYLNRLTGLSSQPGASGVLPLSYAYNYSNCSGRNCA